jgi:hypothetical protein
MPQVSASITRALTRTARLMAIIFWDQHNFLVPDVSSGTQCLLALLGGTVVTAPPNGACEREIALTKSY